jgi:ABC-2 type transport system permease protein
MNALVAVIKKELASVLRDRTMVIAIVLQLFLASFSSALLLGMLSLYDPDTIAQYSGANIRIGIVDAENMNDEAVAFSAILQEKGLSAIRFPSLQEAKRAYAQRQLQAILVLPQERNDVNMTLILPQSQVESSLIRLVIQEPLKQFENFLREKRGIALRYTDLQGIPNITFEFIYSVILPVLMFFPAFVAGGMVIDSISEEVDGNTLPTLLSAPLSINQIIGAKIAAALLLAAGQILAWLALLRLNNVNVQNSILVFLMAVIIAGILSVGAGLVAALFRDRERSQFVFSLVLLAAAGLSYLVDLSPVQIVARLAVGDYATNGWDVALFGLALAGLGYILFNSSRRLLSS